MNRVILAIFCAFTFSSTAFCGNAWPTAQIADSLKKDANAIIREYRTTYQRTSLEKYSMTVDYVVTVMNEKGAFDGALAIYYDQNSEVTDIDENIYDSKGTLIKSVKKKEFEDYASNNSFTMYSDNRVKVYKPSNNFYPYTVEYTYTVEHKALSGFGGWLPQKGYDTSVEHAELTIETPSLFGLRYKELNYSFKFNKSEMGEQLKYKWEASNLKAIPYERSAPNYLDIFPSVLLSPDEIGFEGSTGDFTSWQSYGNWVYSLIKDRQELPAATVDKMKQLTENIPDKKGKVKAVYNYMQNKTRYVNIALGIGGFQPVMAADVDEKGYGDCKALSNYTKALLEAIGIESFYTEIGSGSSQIIKFPDFTSANQTNHIILCVPLDQDTTWLECTSQNMPFGYISGNNSDRYCLLVTEQGGKLVRTPDLSTEKNTRNSTISVNLAETGAASFEVSSQFRNYLFEDVFPLITESKEEQKKVLLRVLNGSGLQLNDFSIEDNSGDEAVANLYIKGNISSYSSKTGTRLFVEPNMLFPHSFMSYIKDSRKLNLYESTGYVYCDTLNLQIPDNLEIEFLPQTSEMSSVYGTYQIDYQKISEKQIQINRQIQINKGNYPPSEFKEINSFLKGIGKRDKEKIVLNTKKS